MLSLTVEPYVPEPNMVLVRIIKARAGLLPMPLGGVLDGLSQVARDMHLHLEWRHAGGDPVAMLSFPPAATIAPSASKSFGSATAKSTWPEARRRRSRSQEARE